VGIAVWVALSNSNSHPPTQLLGTLSCALECYFRQESLDLLTMTYKGSVALDAIFDVENLSAAVVQIKYKAKEDMKAGRALRPIGIPYNINRPLLYVALFMELGNESNHRETKSQIKVSASPLKDDGALESLWEEPERNESLL
jgi:hypothetical protein